MKQQYNIVEEFIHAAGSYAKSTALIHHDKRITYEDLLQSVRHTAAGLQAKGITRGDKVLVTVPMSIDLYTIVLALFYAGAVPVFLDAWVTKRCMTACLEMTPCKMLIASRKILWLSWLYRPLRRIPRKGMPGRLFEAKYQAQPATVAADDTALITFTTGSTGPPKAANRTHAFLRAQLDVLRPLLSEGQECALTTLPIVVLLHLAMGKATVLPPRQYKMKHPVSMRYLQAAIDKHQVATLVVSPSVMLLLVKESGLPSIQLIITGGGPVFPGLAQAIGNTFPQAQITAVYGSTEAEPISHIDAVVVAETDEALMSQWGLPVGPPDASAIVQIISWQEGPFAPMNEAEWALCRLPAGMAGEIVVTGSHVLKHYINNPGAEAIHKIQVAGVTWHRTGDAGRMDNAGSIYFLGRCSEMIFLNGRTIFPVIMAWQLMQRTGISGAALLLIQKQMFLAVESPEKQNETLIRAFMAEQGIEDATIHFLKRLPRDPRHLTKIDYVALRRMLLRHYGA